MSTFASTLRDIRLAQGHSRRSLAEAIGQNLQAVTAWELGQRVPATTSAAMHGLRKVLGPRAGEMLREHAKAERIAVTFRGVGHQPHELHALELFRRAWERRALTEDIVRAFEAALKGVDFNDDEA